MQKHKKHVHSRRKKTLKKVGWTVLAVVILLAVGSWAWGSTLVQSRVQASFGNNAAYQKKEYDKQRALAKKKYGDTTENTAAVKKNRRQKKVPLQVKQTVLLKKRQVIKNISTSRSNRVNICQRSLTITIRQSTC